MHQITSEQAHIGLAYNVPRDPQFKVETSATQPLIALVRTGGIYDKTEPLDLAALPKMPSAIPPKAFGVGAIISAAEAKHGVRLRTVFETRSIAALKRSCATTWGTQYC